MGIKLRNPSSLSTALFWRENGKSAWRLTIINLIVFLNGFIWLALFIWVRFSNWNLTPSLLIDWCDVCNTLLVPIITIKYLFHCKSKMAAATKCRPKFCYDYLNMSIKWKGTSRTQLVKHNSLWKIIIYILINN